MPESTSNDDRARQQARHADNLRRCASRQPLPEPAEGSWIVGGIDPLPSTSLDLPVRFTSTESVTVWDSGKPDNILIDIKSRPSLLYNQLFGGSLSGIVTSVLRVALVTLTLLFAIIGLFALWMALRLSRTITTSVADLYNATQHIDRGDSTIASASPVPISSPNSANPSTP